MKYNHLQQKQTAIREVTQPINGEGMHGNGMPLLLLPHGAWSQALHHTQTANH